MRVRELVAFGSALSRLDATLKPGDEGLSTATLALEGLSWGAYRIEDAKVEARLAGTSLSAEALASAGRLRLKATGSLEGARPFDVTATLDALDLSPYLRAAGGPADVAASASGRVRVRGTVADPRGVAVDVDLDSFEATHPKWSVKAEEPVRLVVDRARLDIRSLKLSGTGLALEARGGLPFDGSGSDHLTLTSSLDLAVLLPFVEALDRATGRASLRLDVGGSFARPEATGSLEIENALFDGPDFPTPVEKVTGTIDAKRGEIRTESLSARLGGGTVVLAGAVGLAAGRPVRVDATLRARDLELEAGKDVQVRGGGDLTAKGAWSSVLVAGEVRLEDVVYTPTLDLMELLKSFKQRNRRPAKAPRGERFPLPAAALLRRRAPGQGRDPPRRQPRRRGAGREPPRDGDPRRARPPGDDLVDAGIDLPLRVDLRDLARPARVLRPSRDRSRDRLRRHDDEGGQRDHPAARRPVLAGPAPPLVLEGAEPVGDRLGSPRRVRDGEQLGADGRRGEAGDAERGHSHPRLARRSHGPRHRPASDDPGRRGVPLLDRQGARRRDLRHVLQGRQRRVDRRHRDEVADQLPGARASPPEPGRVALGRLQDPA
ncbi:MAG: translocation/assembly module TamB domain-containing protein [Holophagales bacterium]|nr:translocation/assembly module TamB domain-containing protein [Holophagales bacterium]